MKKLYMFLLINPHGKTLFYLYLLQLMSDYARLLINMFLGSLNLVQTLSVIENRICFDPTLSIVQSGISTLLKWS
jgi:hypothetical protein